MFSNSCRITELEKISLQLQSIIFNKSGVDSVKCLLTEKSISTQILIEQLVQLNLSEEVKMDLYIQIIEKLNKFQELKENFNNLLIKEKEKIYQIKNHKLQKFILTYIKTNLKELKEYQINLSSIKT